MSPQVLAILLQLFMDKNGKPNKVLKKLGPELLGMRLESTFGSDGKPSERTFELIKELNGGDSKSKKARAAAQKFLASGGAQKSFNEYLAEDVLAPVASGAARTIGNVVAAQNQVPGMVAQAAAQNAQTNPALVQGTTGGRLLAMAMAAAAAAAQGRSAAKSTLATGFGNTIGNTIDQVTNARRIEGQAARNMQNMQAMQTAQNEPLRNSQWDYMTQQMKEQGRAMGGGRA